MLIAFKGIQVGKIVYLQTENCDIGQSKEMELISVPSRSFGRHFSPKPDRLRFVQMDRNSEAHQLPK